MEYMYDTILYYIKLDISAKKKKERSSIKNQK